MRSMWKGTVSFGLVSIPIHLYSATEGKAITFRQVHEKDGGRIQYKRICTVDGEEVPYSEIAKGYELDDGEMVMLTDEDLANVPVPSSQAIDVIEFLPLEAIDPISYDRSYYLEPQKAAVKPYVLLRDALAKSGRVALVKVTLRQRESLALLRVHADVMVLSTLLWPEEVRTPAFAFLQDEPQVRDQELAMAGSLIESMAEDVFDPDEYRDEYQVALRELIDDKVAGKETTSPGPAKEGKAEVIDLMSALEASINATKSEDGDTTKKPENGKSGSSSRTSSRSSGRSGSSGSGSNGKSSTTKSTAAKSSGTKPSGTKSSGGKPAGKSTSKSDGTTRRTKKSA